MVGTTLAGASPARNTAQAPDAGDELLERLRRANRQALAGFSLALQAARRDSFAVAALAIARCARQLHEIQRLEAQHLYPVIARRFASDAGTNAAVVAMRSDTNAHVRHFLRLVDGLFTRSRPGMPPPSLIGEAEQALSAYLAGKEARLYRFYSLAAADMAPS